MASEKTKLKRDGLVPPDGGWGWVIVIAAGFSNLSMFATSQQFGLLFRDRFARLGFSSSQTTSVSNMHAAVIACVGLLNGPLFRVVTYRQAAVAGSALVFIALLLNTFAYNFSTYVTFYSILFGAGFGITNSANCLVLNTYFKEKRRIATGLTWTVTGLGPIIMPPIITILTDTFGDEGTIFILSGFSLHSFACALLLQPVEWHSRDINDIKIQEQKEPHDIEERQLLNNNTEKHVSETGVTVLVKDNEANLSPSRQTKSKTHSMSNLLGDPCLFNASNYYLGANFGSVAQKNERIRESKTEVSGKQDLEASKVAKAQSSNSEKSYLVTDVSKNHVAFNVYRIDGQCNENKHMVVSIINQNGNVKDRMNLTKNHNKKSGSIRQRSYSDPYLMENEGHLQASYEVKKCLKASRQEDTLKQLPSSKYDDISKNNKLFERTKFDKEDTRKEEEMAKKQSIWQKIVMFFDLELLRDFTFLNLMLGTATTGFSEINFTMLTPFILGDYGLTNAQVVGFMSLLAVVDLSVRFCVPFVAGKIGWENNSFYLFGVMSMALGRIVLTYSQDFPVVIIVAIIIGFGKGLRTVFLALVIPTYVPLHKLPGASGLQLLTSGLFYIGLGPVVGWIKDNSSTEVTLHCLNIFTYITALSWGLEKYVNTKQQKKVKAEIVPS